MEGERLIPLIPVAIIVIAVLWGLWPLINPHQDSDAGSKQSQKTRRTANSAPRPMTANDVEQVRNELQTLVRTTKALRDTALVCHETLKLEQSAQQELGENEREIFRNCGFFEKAKRVVVSQVTEAREACQRIANRANPPSAQHANLMMRFLMIEASCRECGREEGSTECAVLSLLSAVSFEG